MLHKIEIEKANEFIEQKAKDVNKRYRNKYHLMAPIGWMNDPNGFVYFQGEYHLFYQYYPYDSIWGPMHWGHAKSKDLVNWEHLPVALAPSEEYDKDGCFSGSAIVKDDQLYLIYTGHVEEGDYRREVQCLAISEDGIHFEKYHQNPVIAEAHIHNIADIAEFRDPKVFQRGETYYTIVAAQTADQRGQMLLFESANLVDWKFKSVVAEGEKHQGIMWECPDLFHLDGKDVLIFSPIQMAKQDNSYWNTSSTVAFIGEMDWETGKLAIENYHEIDYGLDFYAPQTCEGPNGERMMVAWMQMWNRNMPTNDLGHLWAGSMTLPRELHVEDNRLIQTPVKGICRQFNEQPQDSSKNYFANVVKEQQYVHAVVEINEQQEFTFAYAKNGDEALKISYQAATEMLTVSRETIGYPIKGIEETHLVERKMRVSPVDGQLDLELFRDTSSLEVFANGQTMSFTFFEKVKGTDIAVESTTPLTIKLLTFSQ
uniref:glycoside hydrolase family 32 protein n=1 Tax=Candidatus Enterococcus willemsii TaxID=1857215 RepID=UPI00403F9110